MNDFPLSADHACLTTWPQVRSKSIISGKVNLTHCKSKFWTSHGIHPSDGIHPPNALPLVACCPFQFSLGEKHSSAKQVHDQFYCKEDEILPKT